MLKKLNQLHIQPRLMRAFIMVAGLLATVATIGLVTMIVLSNTYSASLTDYGFAQGDIGRVMAQFADSRSALRGVIGYDDQDAIDTLMKNHDNYKSEFTREFAELESTMVTAANKALYQDLKIKLDSYWKLEQEILTLGNTTDPERCHAAQEMAINELMPQYEAIYDELTQIMDIKVDRGHALSTTLGIISTVLAIVIGVVILISIGLALSVSKSIAKSISVPLSQIMSRLDTFAKGDLTSPFPTVETKDELADMVNMTINMAATLQFIITDVKNILNYMASGDFTVTSKDKSKYMGDFDAVLVAMSDLKAQMVDTLQSVGEASSQVAAGASNLSDAAQNLAEGATDQAGAVEEMQATITTITDDIRTTANHAEESYNQAQKYAIEAEHSHTEMQAMMDAMARISDASQKVGNIISEIEDIASQTNLLSLNASIEAARAGEAGKGFAVVADQIRQLAEQSAHSAAETRTLIETSLNAIAAGSKTVDVVNSSIDRVLEGIGTIANSSKNISEMATAQAEAMHQAELGVNQISEVVQSNSATAEETSATSEELSAQALTLDSLISKFHY